MNNKRSTSPTRLLLLSSILLAFAGSAHAAQFTVPAAIATNQLDFTIYLPLQHEADLDALLVQQQTAGSANYHKWLTPAQFKSQFGADPASVARVKQHLANNRLTVVSEGAASLHVRGSATAVATALGMSLGVKQLAGSQRIVASARQQLRAELSNEGAVVPTFATVAPHHTHSVKFVNPLSTVPANRSSAFGTYWYDDLKQAYDFPAYSTTPGQGLSGKGATVAILMSSDFLDSDLKAQFTHEHWTGPLPKTVHIPINGATLNVNADAFGEASLDTQQVGGMAPGVTIQEYNIPDLSDDNILAGYQAIVDSNQADVVSSSFGGAEDAYLPSYNDGTDYTGILRQYESLFKQGNCQGITFVASSGDSGGLGAPSPSYLSGGAATFVPAVESPASSPSVTGVGGTNLQTSFTSGNLNSTYVGENAYADPEVPYDPWGFGSNVSGGYWGSGGGVSKVFAQPAYQKLVATGSTTMRTVPDISLMEGGCPGGLSAVSSACPGSGPSVGRSAVATYINGHAYGLIGTSVSAPGIAGVIALAIEQAGGQRFGNINTLLYTKAAAQAHHVGPAVYHNAAISGFNGYEYTGPIYNQVIGLGTPDVRLLIGAQALPAAGTPQSASNP